MMSEKKPAACLHQPMIAGKNKRNGSEEFTFADIDWERIKAACQVQFNTNHRRLLEGECHYFIRDFVEPNFSRYQDVRYELKEIIRRLPTMKDWFGEMQHATPLAKEHAVREIRHTFRVMTGSQMSAESERADVEKAAQMTLVKLKVWRAGYGREKGLAFNLIHQHLKDFYPYAGGQVSFNRNSRFAAFVWAVVSSLPEWVQEQIGEENAVREAVHKYPNRAKIN